MQKQAHAQKQLLLVSTSTTHGTGYLDHCESEIKEVLGNRKSILFVPYARPSGRTYEEYTDIARERFKKMGIKLMGIHEHRNQDLIEAVEDAEAIFIGGGNTFVLLKALYYAGNGKGVMDAIKKKVNSGTPYIGTSAGSNVAGKTIMATNDMPIVFPPSFEAMGLVPFIINPHYIDPNPDSKHMGETRETRIKEYHVFNKEVVVGLREGAMLHIIGDKVQLKGTVGARIFRQGKEATEHKPGEELDFLMIL
mgnify:CR=1 FL=1